MRRSLWWQIKDITKAGGLILLILTPLWLGLLSTWVTCSVVTSAIKTFSNDCGQRYPVEIVLGGDWFCPEVEDE